jgi:hypothetical protein
MKIDLRKHLTRLVLTALAAVLGSGVVLGIVQANVQEWAKASGNDQYLVKYSGPTLDRLAEITSSGPFVFVTAMLIGGALSLWADTFVRRWLEWRANNAGKFSFRNVDRKLASMTTLFIFVTATVICGAWVLYEQRYGSSKLIDHVPQLANDQKPKPALSEEDRRFRYELRGFSLSTLNDVLQLSGRTFGMLRVIDRKNNEGTAELGARDYFIHFATSTADFGFEKIKSALNYTNVDDIDSDQVQELVYRYFQDYSQFQKFIAQLNAVLGIDLLKTEEMQRWLDADKQCRNELQKLKAWPQAKKLRDIQDGVFASVDRTWERPPIPITAPAKTVTIHEPPSAEDIAKAVAPTEQKLKVATKQRDDALAEVAALKRQIENLPKGGSRPLPPPNPVEYRRLSNDQMRILVDEFSNTLAEIPLIYLSKADDVRGEANQYMRDFKEAFERAGVHSSDVPQKPKPKQTGVIISVVDPEKPPSEATKVQSIFREAGIDAPLSALPPELTSLPTGFTIFIAPNPL